MLGNFLTLTAPISLIANWSLFTGQCIANRSYSTVENTQPRKFFHFHYLLQFDPLQLCDMGIIFCQLNASSLLCFTDAHSLAVSDAS